MNEEVLMRPVLVIIALVVGGLAVVAIVGLVVARLRTPSADQLHLGAEDGRLQPCPESPNCVSSFASPDDETHYVAPLETSLSADAALSAARSALESMPRTAVVEERDGYLRAESRSALFRFVDDVEILVDPAGDRSVVHFRSASRAGYGDMGVNRSRYQEFVSRAGLAR